MEWADIGWRACSLATRRLAFSVHTARMNHWMEGQLYAALRFHFKYR